MVLLDLGFRFGTVRGEVGGRGRTHSDWRGTGVGDWRRTGVGDWRGTGVGSSRRCVESLPQVCDRGHRRTDLL